MSKLAKLSTYLRDTMTFVHNHSEQLFSRVNFLQSIHHLLATGHLQHKQTLQVYVHPFPLTIWFINWQLCANGKQLANCGVHQLTAIHAPRPMLENVTQGLLESKPTL